MHKINTKCSKENASSLKDVGCSIVKCSWKYKCISGFCSSETLDKSFEKSYFEYFVKLLYPEDIFQYINPDQIQR